MQDGYERTCDYEEDPDEEYLAEGADEKDEKDEKDEGEPDARGAADLTPRELGRKGEEMAASYLERRGWRLLERNWRCPYGEADIVAQDSDDDDNDTVVLVEVKTRLALGERADAMPELAVDAHKRFRYRRLALAYLMEHPEVFSIRFDVIALNVVGDGSARLRHLFCAFSLDD
jgi:putative endonuclease